MTEILAIRDHETGQVLECRELRGAELEDPAALYAAKRAHYQPPRYEIVLGMASSLDDFLKSYPRFKGAQGGTDGKGTRGSA